MCIDWCNSQSLGGEDFNISCLPAIDRQSQSSYARENEAKMFCELLHQAAVVDVWRSLNPKKPGFTYYRAKSLMFSRLDYFFISAAALFRVCEMTILPQSMADHNPLSVCFTMDSMIPESRLWRMPIGFLKYPENKSKIQLAIENFILDNSSALIPRIADGWL